MKKRWAALLLAISVTISSTISGSSAVVYAAEAENGSPSIADEAETEEKEKGDAALQDNADGTETSEAAGETAATENVSQMENGTEQPEAGSTAKDTEQPEAGGTVKDTEQPEAGSTTKDTEQPESEGTETDSEQPETGSTTDSEQPESNGTEDMETSGDTEDIEDTEEIGDTEQTEAIEEATEGQFLEAEEGIRRHGLLEESTEEGEEIDLPTGLLPLQEINGGTFDETRIYDAGEDQAEKDTDLRASKSYSSEWDKYSSNYIYNQLDNGEQKIWDELDAMCLEYLTTSVNAAECQGGYCTDYVYFEDLTANEAVELLRMFRYSNPQYYFLGVGYIPMTFGGQMLIALEVYPSFAKGSARKVETAKVKKQAEAWVTMASAYGKEEQKVKAIHDAIVNKVDYDDYFPALQEKDAQLAYEYEQTAYTQSAYSVFCTDTTVCAGYAQALEMVLNGAGIDSIAVTSGNHEWNKVRINDSWYNVDATWADQSWGIYYEYYLRNDAFYDTGSAGEVYSHTEEDFWNPYLPGCSLDSGSTALEAGILPAITAVTATPVIKITKSGNYNKVSITCNTPGAAIYYTTDGTEPSQAFTRSRLYKKALTLKEAATIKAVAVRDTCWDSAVASGTASVSYKVAFKGNGSTSGKMSTQSVTYGSGTKLTANAFKRKGYTFKGWNTKADGSGKSYKNKADGSKLTKTGGKTVTLYAQWTRTKYTITYKLNGGKNNSKNPAYYTSTTATIKLKDPTKKGYKFAGWYTDAKYKNKITQIKKGSTGKKTLYAKWTKTKYKITYNLNGGKNSSKNPASYYVTTKTIKLKNPTRAGYKFMGWYTDSKYKKKVTQIKKGSTGNIKLYAKWKKK